METPKLAAVASPLWPLTIILSEIAQRVARRQAEEHALNANAAGAEPAAREVA